MVDIANNETSQPFDLFLNIIGTNKLLDTTTASSPPPRRPQQRSRFASGEFPKSYDLNQPAKSWWRYFQKQTETNTAMCYTCGAVFNRGPKQSTTSLSHHLKMYHREQFIFIQQAKDDDIKMNKGGKKVKPKPKVEPEDLERQQDEDNQHWGKKNGFNISLIKAVRSRPEIFDVKMRAGSDEDLGTIWESVANEIGEGVTVESVKKRWLQIRDRYRKELKFAIRDNFAYEPKWPYFWDLGFLDEHLRDTAERTNVGVRPPEKRKSENGNNNDFQNLLDESASNLLTNIFSACAQQSSPDSVDNEAESTDSAIASTSENDADENEQKPANILNISHLLHEKNDDQALLEVPSKRPRKSTPTRSKPIDDLEADHGRSFDWLEDEDMLFGKIVALRLRSLPAATKKQIKISIEKIFERHERGLS
ncbi:unnamed protein product [Bursaphelenchus xylophilus]|uniref:(pine wood nematode) hypothetical protein n=1 Tax=Bursaphelenchus xylophilus TaxID=6326 RepID=A0A1I7RPG1_BURXY|nr:unnamed protein product [Bursaphelenchus xylophilus]CAG9095966.1 unnamed protein product [Bursaphelenchus xylophilus]